jgi:hypothetical protein
MASNIQRDGWASYKLSVAATHPTTPANGDPVRYGVMTGIALINEGDDISGETSIEFGAFISKHYVDDDLGVGIAKGDTIFYQDTATGSPATRLNNNPTNGYFWGFALETVGTNATTQITVLHCPSPGASALANGGVGTAQLATGAVTAAKLSATLKAGFVPVSLQILREVVSNDIPNTAATGGLLTKNTTPILEFINGDTDSAIRLNWAASNSDPVTFQVPLPPDLDEAAVVEVHLRAAMGGATDTPVISADTFFNEGDTKVEDDSAAITGTSYAEYTISIAAADVPAGAQTMSVELTPGAHTTDALYITAVWVEYTRA